MNHVWMDPFSIMEHHPTSGERPWCSFQGLGTGRDSSLDLTGSLCPGHSKDIPEVLMHVAAVRSTVDRKPAGQYQILPDPFLEE